MDEKFSASAGSVVAGIDVGGTFTDLLLIDGKAGGKVHIAKTPTTVENQAFGVVSALGATGFPVDAIDLIVHGTTTTTNAVLERRLARTGMITTRGFRDVIELGRRTRPQAYGMTGTFVPVIPRDLRLEVSERVEASGAVRIQLDEAEMRDAVKKLLDAGCESLVIHFLHSYANPAHERRAAEIAAEIWPNGHITTGHALLSEAREFERGVTAAVNASVQPILERYVERLRKELASKGYARDFLIMNGNGGMISARFVTLESAKTVMSGPASGVIAAAYTGKRAGFGNLVTYDMGGTSTDVALIRNAEPAVSNEIEIEYAMPIHVPMVAVHTVGAGGGSIARVDAAGLIQIGPESAGANPGPICYGRGGAEPTITDANLVLGRLAPKKLLAVDNPVTVERVTGIFEEKIGKRTGLSGVEAAGAVLRLGNMKMAGAIRMVSVSRGHDPRDFALFAFGGAGPLHATALARELGLPRVLVPARPGITNALGCVVADMRHDFVNTINIPVGALDEASLREVLERHRNEGEALIAKEAVKPDAIRVTHSADMQFVGQTHIIHVPLPSSSVSRETLQQLFEKAYFARFKVE
ncbi:MAG: hydantoinase/oxoprolinase family protein, partial [Mesorhizobium sp.]|nr:hydantoinase/oxoprolinase family protein [Mesorhizobium sp.]